MADKNKNDEALLKKLAVLKRRALDVKFDLDLNQYTPLENIGTGAYGVVCSAIHKKSNDRVAIKKIPNVFDVKDVAKRTYREIKILKHFKHDNIIHIREILKPKETMSDFRDVYVVFNLMESDLHKIIYSKQELTEEHVRYFLYQILRGLKYIHSAHVIHRDLKPSNLLVNEDCQLKIGDFGMARGFTSSSVEPNFFMTQYVATRWYRAPEIMLSLIEYGAAVDMWSVGCIFAEMLGRKHLFPGKDSISQIKLIVGIVGTPDDSLLQLCHSPIIKNFFEKMGKKEPVPWAKMFPKASKKAIKLLSQMLVLHPKKRITVEQALVHPYLNKYHDPDDEPICVPVFNFDFEKEDLHLPQLREVIHMEIMEYHQPRTPTLSFNALLRPVPKSSDDHPLPLAFKFTGPDQKTQSVTLNQRESTPPDKPASVNTAKDTNKPQPIIVKKPDPEDDVFKKPLSAKNSDSTMNVNTVSLLKTESTDIEMLSAKSTDGKQPMSGIVQEEKTKENTEPLKDDKNKTISEDTKILIKNALKNASFKKRTDSQGDEERNKPITAAMRQKEREDKRKKKKEKTMERKRKEKKKNQPKDELLTSEDKELLQRWAKMQKANVPIAPKPVTEGTGQVNQQGQSSCNKSNEESGSNQGAMATSQAPPFHDGARNVQPETLNLLQQRLLSGSQDNLSNNNSNRTEQVSKQNFQEIGQGQCRPVISEGQSFNTNSGLKMEDGVIGASQNNSSGNFNVDFSGVQLGDLDFLTMVTSPEILTQNTISDTQTHPVTTCSEDQFSLGNNVKSLDSKFNKDMLSSESPSGFLHTLCSEGTSQVTRESGHFSPPDVQHTSSPHLSVSPNFQNQVSPPQYLSAHSPDSQHSVSPNPNVSPNLSYGAVSSQDPQGQMSGYQHQAMVHQQQQQHHHHQQQQQSHLHQQQPDHHQQPHLGVPFQSAPLNLDSINPGNLFMSSQAQNQPQCVTQSEQNFLYRNQAMGRDTGNTRNSNSNSNSPPLLTVNTRQAQLTFQDIFQQPGPSGQGPSISQTQVDLIALVTKQMSKSNVDDLCPPLALTPRGTGGGYGVGVNDSVMTTQEVEAPGEEPSPLSSSILADWMEVTSNLNIDMDALEQELQSPMVLSYNDLNMYSS